MDSDPYDLKNLVDIVSPEPVTWWPPATGWWFVLAVAFVWIAALIVTRIVRWYRNRYRREAIKLLHQINPSTEQNLVKIGALLKRVALVAYPRENVASLSGSDWLTFLENTAKGTSFSSKPTSHLATAASETKPCALTDREFFSVVQTAEEWIQKHQVEVPKC